MLEEFRLLVPPRVPIVDADDTLSLAAKGFCPAIAFTVQLLSTQGIVTSVPRAGEKSAEAFVSEILSALEAEGFLPWEREQWGRLVQGMVRCSACTAQSTSSTPTVLPCSIFPACFLPCAPPPLSRFFLLFLAPLPAPPVPPWLWG